MSKRLSLIKINSMVVSSPLTHLCKLGYGYHTNNDRIANFAKQKRKANSSKRLFTGLYGLLVLALSGCVIKDGDSIFIENEYRSFQLEDCDLTLTVDATVESDVWSAFRTCLDLQFGSDRVNHGPRLINPPLGVNLVIRNYSSPPIYGLTACEPTPVGQPLHLNFRRAYTDISYMSNAQKKND